MTEDAKSLMRLGTVRSIRLKRVIEVLSKQFLTFSSWIL